jgi:hypothetical protein
MSVTTVLYIHCDGCGDAYSIDPDPTSRVNNLPGTTAKAERDAAEQDGWAVARPGGLDYCETCAEAGAGS